MVSAQPVVERGEIYLGGTWFNIKGKVRVANISVTPNPILFGDASRQGDTQVMSQLIQTSQTGGSGVYKANPRTDQERFWDSEIDTRYRLQLCLPPLTYVLGRPAAVNSDPLVSKEFNNIQYTVFAGGLLYRWNDVAATFNDNGTVTGGWSALLAILSSNPTDAVIYRDYLYFAYGASTQKMATTEVVSAVAGAATFLYVWDEKLWKIYLNANVWTTAFTSTGGSAAESFTAGAVLPSGVIPSQLTTFRNVAGDEVLCLLTNVGLWLYDATNVKWRQTEVRIPPMPFNQRSRGDIFRDGKLYFTTGAMGMASVQPGNPFVITPMGLDRDDGIPTDQSGRFIDIKADFNWLLGLVDGSRVTGEDTMYSGLASPFDTPEWPVQSGVVTLKAFGTGWNTLWKSGGNATPGFVLEVSGAYSKRRVYWSASKNIYMQELATTVHNPRFNPTPKFAPGPLEHVTSWYDYGSDIQNKIQGHFHLRTTGCSDDETVAVYYQIDLQESSWTLLDTITTNDVHELKPGGIEGVQCRMVRFRFVLQRGSSAALTPRIEFWAADFMRVLPATYAFVVMIDLSKKCRDQMPAQLVQVLKDLADPLETPGLIPFAYQDEFDAEPQTYYGRISRLQGQSEADPNLRGEGWFQMSFTVPYLGDTL